MNPLEFIDWYHILILHLAAMLKLLTLYGIIELKLKKEKRNFVWQVYFKDNWDNWLAHYISMWLLLMILPSLVDIAGEWVPVLKEVKESESLNLLLTAGIGYFGFDAAKYIMNKFQKK